MIEVAILVVNRVVRFLDVVFAAFHPLGDALECFVLGVLGWVASPGSVVVWVVRPICGPECLSNTLGYSSGAKDVGKESLW